MSEAHFATNLRRLLLFEHHSGKEAAVALGVTDASVSRWLTGKRYPGAQALIAIERLYGVSPRELDEDPVDFAQRLADPARIKYAEATRRRAAKKGELTAADAKAISDRAKADTEAAVDRLKVVPMKRRAKK
jgi:transcriptional regulator with XRE-family HTH domain